MIYCVKHISKCLELSIDEQLRFVVEHVYLDSSPRPDTNARIYLNLLTINFLSVVGDVPVDSDDHVVTSLIFLEAHRGRNRDGNEAGLDQV